VQVIFKASVTAVYWAACRETSRLCPSVQKEMYTCPGNRGGMLWVEHRGAESHQPSGEHQSLDCTACPVKTNQNSN